jgi:hypothetical protein
LEWVSRRPVVAALLAAVLSCSDAGPSGRTIREAGNLAAQLEAIGRAVSTPQLRGLSGLANPIKIAGIDVHNMSDLTFGRTLEWSAVQHRLFFSERPGAPASGIRLILYVTDSTHRPAYPPVEVGYADLLPYNTFNGGGPDSMSLRFIVTDTRPTTPIVVADFLAHSHADTACQCATVEGWVNDGSTRVDFSVSYHIPLGGDGRFPGTFLAPSLALEHFATLPGPGISTSTTTLDFIFAGDTISATSGLLRARAGRLEGESEITINGEHFARVSRITSGIVAIGPGGRPLSNAETRALSALFTVPADIAYYIEWPTFVIFFCGCSID